jgi:hypothetical protein
MSGIALIAILPLAGLAEVYKQVDKNGSVIFSDTAAPGAEKIQLTEPNTATPVTSAPSKPDALTGVVAADSYNSLAITHPKDQEIIPNGLLAIQVSAEVSPGLLPGHQLQLHIDGKVHSSNRTGFTINGMPRGEHQLQVTIIDSEDKVLKQSAAITLYVYRPAS